MRRAYRGLLRLYPYDYRYAFGAEMCEAFKNAQAERNGQGSSAFVRFAAGELASLLMGAMAEWKAKWTSGEVRRRSLPDLRLMRPAEIHGSVWFARVKGGGDAAGL